MGSTEPIGGDANPEEAAITGGAPAAAEPPPFTRGRRSSAVASAWIYVIAGIALIITALVADQDSGRAIAEAVIGAALLIVGGLSIAGHVDPATRAIFGFLLGVLLTVAALSSSDIAYPELILLVVGAATFIASFASLAASRRLGSGASADEPGPGVGSV